MALSTSGDAAKIAKFNELLEIARNASHWLRNLSDHAYGLAQVAGHAGHKRALENLGEAAARFADQVSRTKDF